MYSRSSRLGLSSATVKKKMVVFNECACDVCQCVCVCVYVCMCVCAYVCHNNYDFQLLTTFSPLRLGPGLVSMSPASISSWEMIATNRLMNANRKRHQNKLKQYNNMLMPQWLVYTSDSFELLLQLSHTRSAHACIRKRSALTFDWIDHFHTYMYMDVCMLITS